eukprot:scaffold1684_cov214-Amphora_coffeaeformis.AAC.26
MQKYGTPYSYLIGRIVLCVFVSARRVSFSATFDVRGPDGSNEQRDLSLREKSSLEGNFLTPPVALFGKCTNHVEAKFNF